MKLNRFTHMLRPLSKRDQAEKQLAAGEANEAIRMLRSAASSRLATKQQRLDAQSRLASVLIEEGHTDDALASLRAMTEAKPDHAEPWKRLAEALEAAGDNPGAIQAWRRALTLSANDSEALESITALCVEGGYFNDAILYLEALTQASPNEPEPWRLLGDVLKKVGQLEQAEKAWLRVLLIAPAYLEAHESVAALKKRRGDHGGAIPHLVSLAKAHPEQLLVWQELGNALVRSGSVAEALDIWRHAVEIAPQDPSPRMSLASLLFQLGRLPESATQLRRVVKAAPTELKPLVLLGRALTRTGSTEEALDVWKRVLALEPNHPEAQSMLSKMLSKRLSLAKAKARSVAQSGDIDGAIATLREAVEADPLNKDAHESLATMLSEAERPQDAIAVLKRAANLSPGNVESIRRMARLQKQVGDLEGAISSWKQVLGIEPKEIEAHKRLGTLLRNVERYAEAVPYFEALVSASPDRLEPLKWLARTLEDAGYRHRAADTWRKAAAVAPSDPEPSERLQALLADTYATLPAGSKRGSATTVRSSP